MLKVKDDNDHSPVFDADIYEASIEENNRQGAVLFRVTANDQDIGDNGRIDYTINPEVERFVTVDRESGLVRAAVSLDRELVSELNIYLTATDRGQPSRSSSTRLHLVVLDVDDNGPEFDATRFRLRVAENQPARTEVRIVALRLVLTLRVVIIGYSKKTKIHTGPLHSLPLFSSFIPSPPLSSPSSAPLPSLFLLLLSLSISSPLFSVSSPPLPSPSSTPFPSLPIPLLPSLPCTFPFSKK